MEESKKRQAGSGRKEKASNPAKTKLRKLNELKKEGLITEEEYKERRKKILDKL